MTRPHTQYLEVIFDRLPRSIEPALSSWLFRHGCWGTQEKLDFTQEDLKYDPMIKQKRIINVSAYFDPNSREGVEGPILVWLNEHSPSTKIHWQIQNSKDWLAEWKKHFKSFKIAGIKIVPAWEQKKASPRENSLVIEPGMAFGTGTHATTKFAMRMIQKISKTKDFKNATVLDVGAGSGILSVVAEKYGARSVLAIDNDPESWRECKKLFRLNKTRKCKVTPKQIKDIQKQYDLVIANIIDGILMDLKPSLWQKTKSGGHIILSGILTVGSSAFEKSFMSGKSGKILARLQDEEWTSLLISK